MSDELMNINEIDELYNNILKHISYKSRSPQIIKENGLYFFSRNVNICLKVVRNHCWGWSKDPGPSVRVGKFPTNFFAHFRRCHEGID